MNGHTLGIQFADCVWQNINSGGSGNMNRRQFLEQPVQES